MCEGFHCSITPVENGVTDITYSTQLLLFIEKIIYKTDRNFYAILKIFA